MFSSINNKLNSISNGYPNRRTPFMLINNEINVKITEKGIKRGLHSILWERNQQKLRRNSVSFELVTKYLRNPIMTSIL
jgi:hypothetical protein